MASDLISAVNKERIEITTYLKPGTQWVSVKYVSYFVLNKKYLATWFSVRNITVSEFVVYKLKPVRTNTFI